MIRVRALGGCEIQVGRKRITLTTEVPFALAFYLTQRAGERLTRDELAESFWDFRDPPKARHSLRQTLYKLRQKGLPLDEGAEEVALEAEGIESDVARVLTPEWPASASAEEVEAAGDLLPGLTRRMAPGFMDWLDALRSQVAAAHRRGALAQIIKARREGRWADLERWGQQVLRTDPLNEEATLARAESAAMAGSKAIALEILDEYIAELGDTATKIGLPANVLRRRIAERQPEWAGRGPREVPLVGRTELMAKLTGYVEEAARGRGGGVMLWGAPGVGKTRLATEVRTYAELRGFTVVTVRCDISHSARPLATVLAILPQLLHLPGAAGCSPASMSVAQRALRQDGAPDLLTPLAGGSDAVAALRSAMVDLIRSIGAESRVAISVDDSHHTDESSIHVVRAMIAATVGTRVIWLLTSRGRDPWWGVGNTTSVLSRNQVPPLSATDAQVLAMSFAATLNRPHKLSPDQVAIASGGNPLFVRELTAHNETPSEGLPNSLQAVVSDRLDALAAPDLLLLRAVTLLGPLATLARLARIAGVDAQILAAAVDQLEQDGIVRLGVAQTLELHEVWQGAIADSFGAATRAALSLHCAHLLINDSDSGPTLDRLWRAAELFEAAGERDRARTLYSECAARMIQRGAASDAIPILSRALPLARDPIDRMEIDVQIARAASFSGAYEDCVHWARAARAETLLPSERSALYSTIAQSLLVEALTKLRRDHKVDLSVLATLATDKQVPASARLFACLFGIRVVLNDAQSPLENVFRDAARSIAQEQGPTLVSQLVELVWTTERDSAAKIDALDAQFSLSEFADEPVKLRAMAFRYRAAARRTIGAFLDATNLATRCYELASEVGLLDEAGLAAETLSFMRLDLNDTEGAMEWIDRWERVEAAVAYPHRTHSLSHARARLALQLDQPHTALEIYRKLLPAIANDTLSRRRVADQAIVAFAAALVGDQPLRDQSLAACLQILLTEPAAAFLDFPVEMTLRALEKSGRNTEAEHLGKRYIDARQKRLPQGLPPVCMKLHKLLSA